MKKNEVRIGNWVFDPKGNDNTQISDVDFISEFFEQLRPIALTEEWLEKFGFVSEPNSMYWKRDDIEIVFSWTYTGVLFDKKLYYFQLLHDSIDHIGAEFTTVHQLQNLFFGLTGEELEIKEQ